MAPRILRAVTGTSPLLARVEAIVADVGTEIAAAAAAREITDRATALKASRRDRASLRQAEAEAWRIYRKQETLIAVGLAEDDGTLADLRANAERAAADVAEADPTFAADDEVLALAQDRRREAGAAVHDKLTSGLDPIREEVLDRYRRDVAAMAETFDLLAALGVDMGPRPLIGHPVTGENFTGPVCGEARRIDATLASVRWAIRSAM